MSERNQTELGTTSGPSGPEEERLRALFAAAYLPLEPSEALRQRVAAVVAQREAQEARRRRWWTLPFGGALSAGALAAAALLAALGWTALRWPHHRAGAPSIRLANGGRLKSQQQRHEVRLRGLGLPEPPQGGFVSQLPRFQPPGNNAPTASSSGAFVAVSPLRPHGASVFGAPAPRNEKGWSSASPAWEGVPHRARPAAGSPASALDDMAFLNPDPRAVARRWAPLPRDEWEQIEARVRHDVPVKDDFIQISFPRLASTAARQIAEAVDHYKHEAAIADPRLAREVTLAFKGAALADVCEQLHAQRGIALTAGRSVADEKVTIFCEKTPLRQVMREINRLFGYTWLRSGKPSEFKYELEQDLRSQLLEEELRNRDRDAALVVLDEQMQQFRPYLDEGFDRLQQQWEKAGKRPGLGALSRLMMDGIWGGAQLYFRLTPRDRAALIAGQELVLRADAADPDHRIPNDWQRPLLQTRNTSISMDGGRMVRLADLPGVRVVQVRLQLNRSELGQVSLKSRVTTAWRDDHGLEQAFSLDGQLAMGRSPSVEKPDNATANATLRSQPPLGGTPGGPGAG